MLAAKRWRLRFEQPGVAKVQLPIALHFTSSSSDAIRFGVRVHVHLSLTADRAAQLLILAVRLSVYGLHSACLLTRVQVAPTALEHGTVE